MAAIDPCYSSRLDEALGFVAEAFRHRVRKGSGVPYLTHLLQVMVTVAEHGGDEDQMVAALLHDYLEDIRDADRDALAERFGEPVTRMVEALSDSTTHPKPPWAERKRAYLDKLAGEPGQVKLVCSADKLHNASCILRDYRRLGDDVWKRFTPNRDQTLWYYRGVVVALATDWEHAILDDVRRVVSALHAEVGVPLDGRL